MQDHNVNSWEPSNYVVDLLNNKYDQFNRPSFIEFDPVSIPHLFSKKQDIEISGLFAAVLAWGQRKTIISKCKELMERFDHAPHDFILNCEDSDLKRFEDFKHRTFNGTDTLYFIEFLRNHYQKSDTLEDAFYLKGNKGLDTIKESLTSFDEYFRNDEFFPDRTKKHIASPARSSTCKRLNMYLRWMVRVDDRGVDFGIWRKLEPSQLICPCDVHVERVARHLGLIQSPKVNWNTAIELTENLRKMDAVDPVKYDFALFGLGVEREL